MINYYYPTPVYTGYAQPLVRTLIQTDFQKVVDNIQAGSGFLKNPNWPVTSHKLSDPSFKSNLIDDYNLTAFYNELRHHIKCYMQETNAYHINMFKITESWMTLTSKGDHAIMHTHGSSDLSGVYYFQTNGQDGRIYFRSPNRYIANSHAFHNAPDQIEIDPEVGKFILFPGWLEHGICTNNTDNERISISFNISFKPIIFDNEKDKL